MASLGVLASLMQTMTPNMPQYNPQEVALAQQRIQGGRMGNETALIELQQLKEKQAAEQEYLRAIQQNPALAQQLLGGSTIAGLPTMGGPPGAGPMTQQTTMPGQPPGAAQVVPGGQDLSQFATQGGPPQSVLGSLGPQPQGPMQPQQNPVLAMAAQNPRAAMMLQQQMQAQQDRQFKMQEQKLKIGSAMMGSLGQMAQGVTDQAGWDQLRQDAAQIDPQMAARLPQVYSKEVRDRVVAQALDVKDRLTLQIQELEASTKAGTLGLAQQKAAQTIPNYTGDAQLDAIIYTKMKDQPAGTIPSREIVQDAYKQREDDKLRVSREQGREQGVTAAEIERTEKPLEGAAAKSVSDLTLLRTMTDDMAALRHDDYTGPVVGRTGFVREQTGQMKEQEVAFRRTVKDVQDILGRLRSGAAIPAPEMSRLEGLAPSVNDPPDVFKSKLQSFQRALEQNRESILRTSTTGRGRLREETTPTTPRVGQQSQGQSQGQPTSQGSLKPVSQMNAEETRAEIAAIKARGGR